MTCTSSARGNGHCAWIFLALGFQCVTLACEQDDKGADKVSKNIVPESNEGTDASAQSSKPRESMSQSGEAGDANVQPSEHADSGAGIPTLGPDSTTTRDSGEPTVDAGDARLSSDSGAITARDCRFEYLGDWLLCEDSGYPNIILIEATSLQDCMDACIREEECGAVTDYSWDEDPEMLVCQLKQGSCDNPRTEVWAEEDGGKQYKKVCGEALTDAAAVPLPEAGFAASDASARTP